MKLKVFLVSHPPIAEIVEILDEHVLDDVRISDDQNGDSAFIHPAKTQRSNLEERMAVYTQSKGVQLSNTKE